MSVSFDGEEQSGLQIVRHPGRKYFEFMDLAENILDLRKFVHHDTDFIKLKERICHA